MLVVGTGIYRPGVGQRYKRGGTRDTPCLNAPTTQPIPSVIGDVEITMTGNQDKLDTAHQITHLPTRDESNTRFLSTHRQTAATISLSPDHPATWTDFLGGYQILYCTQSERHHGGPRRGQAQGGRRGRLRVDCSRDGGNGFDGQ